MIDVVLLLVLAGAIMLGFVLLDRRRAREVERDLSRPPPVTGRHSSRPPRGR